MGIVFSFIQNPTMRFNPAIGKAPRDPSQQTQFFTLCRDCNGDCAELAVFEIIFLQARMVRRTISGVDGYG
jgi:hypothetical protein